MLIVKRNLFFLGLFFIFYSCNKKEGGISSTDEIVSNEAKIYLSQKINKQVARWQGIPLEAISKPSIFHQVERVRKSSHLLDWPQAYHGKIDKADYLLVPAGNSESFDSDGQLSLHRYFLFYKKENGLDMKILEVLGNRNAVNSRGYGETLLNTYLLTSNKNETHTLEMFVYDDLYRFERGIKTDKLMTYLTRAKLSPQNRDVGKTNQKKDIGTSAGNSDCVLWGMYHIIYDGNHQVISETLLFTYWVCGNGNASEEYGDPNGTGSNDPCFDVCNESFDALVDATSTASSTISDISTDINGFQKRRLLIWTCLRNPFGWRLDTKETGVVELVDPEKNTWVWKSLEHVGIDFIGNQPPGGTVTHSQGVGTASFMPGTPNVLYAGMSVNFTVTFSPICSNCPLLSQVITPKTNSYNSSAIWSAKP